MTITGGPQIAVSNATAEIGLSNSNVGFNTIHNLVLPSLRQSYEQMTEWYNKTYFRHNNQGNCNNGNCPSFNCGFYGSVNCFNCYNCYNINCTNCDTQSWLQNNCNC